MTGAFEILSIEPREEAHRRRAGRGGIVEIRGGPERGRWRAGRLGRARRHGTRGRGEGAVVWFARRQTARRAHAAGEVINPAEANASRLA
ncbi:MAG: hypothetical protein MZW92_52795 [Comamonadaceae bacterium]|nr:hypothetical protein [Comamonadaceae bacterium]